MTTEKKTLVDVRGEISYWIAKLVHARAESGSLRTEKRQMEHSSVNTSNVHAKELLEQ